MLKQIIKIQNFRIFRDYSWSNNLKDFKKLNVIYGWNGSGKTTLSTFLRQLEGKKSIAGCGEFAIQTDNEEINENNLSSSNLMIRVFNEDFIKENIFTPSNKVTPIFFLGEEDIAKQKEIQDLKNLNISLDDDESGLISDLEFKKRQIDDISINEAKRIKDFLRSNRENKYNNYNKADFKNKCNSLKEEDYQIKILDDKNLLKMKNTIESPILDPISKLSLSLTPLVELKTKIERKIKETVVSLLISRLENDKELNLWVGKGLNLLNERNTKICPFCEQPITSAFVEKLEGHFNDQYNQFIKEIDTLIQEISIFKRSLNLYLPSKNEFYPEFSEEYEINRKNLEHDLEKLSGYLDLLYQDLKEKKKNPFQQISSSSKEPNIDAINHLDRINELIEQHNHKTQNFVTVVEEARQSIEDSFVADKLTIYLALNENIMELEKNINLLRVSLDENQKEITKLEGEIIQHRQPAEEINHDLFRFLGRDEIKFEVKENGYQITRYGKIAEALSESEKTAISFIYFLKKLREKDFKIEDGIVVIDDPISSLDANSLHNAFEFMKYRTNLASQLFILTHNFSFLREVNNWLKRNRDSSSYYMLKNKYSNGYRIAFLDNLDKFLKDYNSEYHYLFSLVYKNAKNEAEPLENYYLFPNISRRLLESFLAFRIPSETLLWKQMDKIQFDEVKKVRIYRFVNDNSHANHIRVDPHRDLSFLAETQAVSEDLLDLIKNVDPNHYREMVATIEQG